MNLYKTVPFLKTSFCISFKQRFDIFRTTLSRRLVKLPVKCKINYKGVQECVRSVNKNGEFCLVLSFSLAAPIGAITKLSKICQFKLSNKG